MPELEEKLLARAVGGDQDALDELLQRVSGDVRAGLTGQIPRRWQAVLSVDDVLQETYIDAFLDIGRFEPRGPDSFIGWLLTLARRNLIDTVRMLEAEKRGRDRRQVSNDGPDGALSALLEEVRQSEATPSRQMAAGEALAALREAVGRLPATYRTAVELYNLQGRPVEEVAAALGRSPGAVFMLCKRAQRYLAELLGSPSRFLSGPR